MLSGEVYTQVPRGPVDGIYGERTKEAVRQFQSVFGLGQTGVVDYPTWYKIRGNLCGNYENRRAILKELLLFTDKILAKRVTGNGVNRNRKNVGN